MYEDLSEDTSLRLSRSIVKRTLVHFKDYLSRKWAIPVVRRVLFKQRCFLRGKKWAVYLRSESISSPSPDGEKSNGVSIGSMKIQLGTRASRSINHGVSVRHAMFACKLQRRLITHTRPLLPIDEQIAVKRTWLLEWLLLLLWLIVRFRGYTTR